MLPARVQDLFGRGLAQQVLGPAVDDLDALQRTLAVDVNAAAETPLVSGDDVLRTTATGHAMPIALALDVLRLSLHSVATLSTSWLANLVDPEFTGLSRFPG